MSTNDLSLTLVFKLAELREKQRQEELFYVSTWFNHKIEEEKA